MTKDDSRIVKDPICGKDVDTLRARAVGIFGGVTYYFCSAECKAKYQDPRQQPRAPVEPAAPAKVLVATDSPKRKAEKAAAAAKNAERPRAEKSDASIKLAKSDKSGRFAKVEPAAVAKADPATPARIDAKTEPSGRVIEVEAEPSSHFEQAEELTPIPTTRRRFPLLALLLLALLVAGGVVLFTLKHK
jgi:YHS domain-containing protein